jgi:DNA-directed RNA polymerase alpha subunit
MSFDSTSLVVLINVEGVDLSIRSGRCDAREGWKCVGVILSEAKEPEFRFGSFASLRMTRDDVHSAEFSLLTLNE